MVYLYVAEFCESKFLCKVFLWFRLFVTHQVYEFLLENICISFRSSRPEVFCKKGVLKNFTKFTEKHLCQNLFSLKVAGLKKEPWHRCFPVNFVKFLRTPFLQNTSGGCFISLRIEGNRGKRNKSHFLKKIGNFKVFLCWSRNGIYSWHGLCFTPNSLSGNN